MDAENAAQWSQNFATVWFFIFFIAIIAYAFWPSNKKKFDKIGRMAMEDNDEEREERESKQNLKAKEKSDS